MLRLLRVSTQLLLRVIFPTRYLARGMGINGLIIAVAAAAGPTVAAAILAVANWPWLFAINVPIGLVAFMMSLKFLPQNPVKVQGRYFDIRSAVMNALTFGLLICVIDGFAHDIHWYILVPGFVVMLIIGWFFIKHQENQAYPLLPIDLMYSRIFSLSLLTSVFSFIAQMLALVSIPFFFQRVLHLNEVATGLLLTPWPLATMIAAPLAGRLMDRFNAGYWEQLGYSFLVRLYFCWQQCQLNLHIWILFGGCSWEESVLVCLLPRIIVPLLLLLLKNVAEVPVGCLEWLVY